MAGLVGAEGRVVACEPNPLLASDNLPMNLALNGFQKTVEISSKAVGNVDHCVVDFVLKREDFASSSLKYWAQANRSKPVQVPAITIDRLCTDWPRLDLVKIDVEGAEALVWEGMQKTLRRFPQVVVVLELHLRHDLPQAMSLLHQIETAGYSLRVINYEGEIIETERAAILGQPQEHWALWLQR